MFRKTLYPAIVIALLTILNFPSSDCHAFSMWSSESEKKAGSGPGQTDKLCDKYPLQSQKKFICDSYHESKVKTLESLPTDCSDLDEGMLYIISASANLLNTPYVIPKNAAVIPHPDTAILDISLTGAGTGTKCGVCGISRSEGSMVAGLSINVDQWWPDTVPGLRRSVVYANTAQSLFAESVLWGATGFDDLVYENVQVEAGKHPTLTSLRLYLDGADNGLTVDSSDGVESSASSDSAQVQINDLVVALGGTIIDKNGVQSGVSLTYMNTDLKNAQILFEPIASTATFRRRGIAAEDTPLIIITDITFAVTKSGFRRALDVQEYYANKLSHIKVFSGPNRYIEELAGHPVIKPYDRNTDDKAALEYILVGESKAAHDIDILTDISHVDTFTLGGGSYLASALQLNGTCNTLANGHFNSSNPFPLTSQFEPMMGPANATVQTYTQNCAYTNGNNDCSALQKWKWGAVGAAVGVGGTLLVGGSLALCLWCLKRSSGKAGYTAIGDKSNANE